MMWRVTSTRRSSGAVGIRNLTIAAAMVAAAGCSSKPEPPPAKAAPTYTLRKVALPDLSHAAPSVQQQLRDLYTSLERKIAATSTSNDELALAYGQMGMLLMAAE